MWFDNLINVHSAVQGIVILSLICTLGLALGKIHVKGISLGIAFVFFVGIIAGHFGLSIDQNMLEFAESFGLTMFVYVLGLYVGPNFFGSMRHEGISLNLWSLAVIVVGTLFSLGLCWILPISLPDMMGILCGARPIRRLLVLPSRRCSSWACLAKVRLWAAPSLILWVLWALSWR